MGDELKAKFAAEVELHPDANGIYDVAVDGRLIFSKHQEGRFPELEEIVGLIEKG
jgi:selT/selW/selH-like putative selenoprotein